MCCLETSPHVHIMDLTQEKRPSKMDGAPRCYKWIGRIGIVDFSFILTILPRSWCVVDVFVLVFGSVFGSVYLTVFLSISWIFHRKLRVSHSFILTALYLLFCKKWVESFAVVADSRRVSRCQILMFGANISN